jgi:hypothetical protein
VHFKGVYQHAEIGVSQNNENYTLFLGMKIRSTEKNESYNKKSLFMAFSKHTLFLYVGFVKHDLILISIFQHARFI